MFSSLIYDRFINFVGLNGTQKRGLCPFHKDTDPSFNVNTDTGQWYCFGCPDSEGGGPVKFIQKLFDVSESIAQYAIDFFNLHEGRLPFPDIAEVDACHQELLKQPAVMDWLHDIGIVDDVIKKYNLGWEKTRLIVPILSKTGMIVNLRKYMPPGSRRTEHTPKTIHIKHLGENRYFPYEAFDSQDIYVVEGEKDVLVARSQGINAVTSTGGKAIPASEIHLFRGKNVYLMVDTDSVGIRLVKQYTLLLQTIAKDIHVINLPKKDFAEYFEHYRDINVHQYISDPEEFLEKQTNNVKLKDSIGVSMVGTSVMLQSMTITGKHFNSYTLPKKMVINCSGIQCKKDCPFKEVDCDVNIDERDMLSFLKCPDSIQQQFLQRHVGCKFAKIVSKEYTNAQIIFFQEGICGLSQEDYYGQMQTGVFLFDTEPLQTNKTYDFVLIRTTDPKTQQIIYIITGAVEKSLDIEIDPEKLVWFQNNAKDRDLLDLLKMYYKMWLPHLEVYGRADLFAATLLTYLSGIGFYWGNTLIKGWLDTLILGDTRTGKSKLAKNFMKALSLGAYVSGENARKTGIIGGIQKMGDNWSLSWGIVPLNDKRLVVIDEASGLSVSDIQELSQMRSEGVLSITKIIAESTTARTRILWISNPRSGRPIGDFYWRGVDALTEFLPIQEDLARFDLVVTAALEDVENTHETYDNDLMPPDILDLWRQLTLFAWQLKPEQILLTQEIRDYIIVVSEELGDFYKGIPIFLKTNGYEKITRLSISLAVVTYSYENQKLIIEKRHVDASCAFIRTCYSKHSFGFDSYSAKEKELCNSTDEKKIKVKELMALYPNICILFESGLIRSYTIQEVLGMDKDDSFKLMAELLRLGFLIILNNGYKATPLFLNMMRQHQNSKY